MSLELQMPLANTNYHVTELLRSGLIELAAKRKVRGATEHFYRLVEGTNSARSVHRPWEDMGARDEALRRTEPVRR